MNYADLKTLGKKLYFGVDDLRDLLKVKPESARVLCSRYAKDGVFLRLKNNFYVLSQGWERFTRQDFYKISNLLQVPSYISFMTALSFYEVTTQMQRDFFECASLKRTKNYKVKGAIFNYYKLKKKYYFDFINKGGIFIASKEKAFLDCLHLYSFGKYKLDLSSINMDKLSKNRLKALLRFFPERTQKIARKICKI